MFAGIEVVVLRFVSTRSQITFAPLIDSRTDLQSVHLPVTLGASSSDRTHKRPVPLLGLFDRETQVDCFVNSKIALATGSC